MRLRVAWGLFFFKLAAIVPQLIDGFCHPDHQKRRRERFVLGLRIGGIADNRDLATNVAGFGFVRLRLIERSGDSRVFVLFGQMF
jgi:hypothetical protein